MTASNRGNPPTNWLAGVTTVDAEHGIYALTSGTPTLLWWHWCEALGRWEGMHTRNHTTVSLDPLHLEPSVLCPSCNLHGFIRSGRWVAA